MKILLVSAFILFAILFALTRFGTRNEPATPPSQSQNEIITTPPSFDPNALPELQ